MERHVTVLGILYIAFSALGLLLAIIIFTAVVGGGIISGDSEAMAITGIVGPAIALFFCAAVRSGYDRRNLSVKVSSVGENFGAGPRVYKLNRNPHRYGTWYLYDLGPV
jgi:hypothetical protein